MRVCILSDSHDNRDYLVAAARRAKQAGAEALLHCGDVVSPWVLAALQPVGLPVHLVHGNNTGDLVTLMRMARRRDSVVHYYGQDADIRLGGRRLFLVHYPHYARGMAATGDWEVVCCGHSHQAEIRRVPNLKGGETVLINPGTVGGIDAPATYVMGDLDTLDFHIVALDERLSMASGAS
jgi:putative phosphoesterase